MARCALPNYSGTLRADSEVVAWVQAWFGCSRGFKWSKIDDSGTLCYHAPLSTRSHSLKRDALATPPMRCAAMHQRTQAVVNGLMRIPDSGILDLGLISATFSRVSQQPQPLNAQDVHGAFLSARVCCMLIGASCNPTLCPIHVVKATASGSVS